MTGGQVVSKKSRKQRKREQRAAQEAALAAKKALPAPKQAPKPEQEKSIKCFEVNFALVDAKENVRPAGQYYHQPRGGFQGVLDAFAYVHRYVEQECAKSEKIYAIERIKVYEWALAIPGVKGVINTKKFSEPIFEWTFSTKIKTIAPSFTKKQARRLMAAAAYLDRWRPVRVKVQIEDITQEADNAAGVPLSLE